MVDDFESKDPAPEDRSLDMDAITAHLDRGWDLLRRGDTMGSRLSAQHILELDEDSPEGHTLLLAGRCISQTHEASGCTRPTVQCMVTGEAAGTAAALCARGGEKPRDLDVALLQERLVEGGVIL